MIRPSWLSRTGETTGGLRGGGEKPLLSLPHADAVRMTAAAAVGIRASRTLTTSLHNELGITCTLFAYRAACPDTALLYGAKLVR